MLQAGFWPSHDVLKWTKDMKDDKEEDNLVKDEKLDKYDAEDEDEGQIEVGH